MDNESSLNDTDPAMRRAALVRLVAQTPPASHLGETDKLKLNLHAHTVYSYNAYGYSPTGLAWLARKEGWYALGTVDFDVLDGVDETLEAC